MESFECAMNIILKWDSNPIEQSIFSLNRSEINQYFEAVDKIQQSSISANYHQIANDTISIAITRLKHEFHNTLAKRTTCDHSIIMGFLSSTTESTSLTDSSEYELQFYNYTSEDKHNQAAIVGDLRCIAERMNSAGSLGYCIEVYKSVRKPFVDASFKLLRVEEFSTSLPWENLKLKIEVWIRAAKVFLGFLVAREKQLFEQIFEGLEETLTNHKCFKETIIYSLIRLFNFPEALSRCRRSPVKLFKILDLYNVITDLLPEINVLFQFELPKIIQIDVILIQLEEMVRGILSDFQIGVGNELSIISDTKWALLPLTRNVMDYLILVTNYKKALNRIIVSKPSHSSRSFHFPDKKFTPNEGLTPLSVHLILIIMALRFNLEGKSKHYKETTTSVHFFMMNNVQYIVQNIKGSPELREMVGEDYLKKLSDDVMQEVKNYKLLTCKKILYCLREDGLCWTNCVSSRVSKSAVRKRIKSFNAILEEVRLDQETWGVPDLELREELRLSILGSLVPAYKYFLERFGNHIESRKNNHIKYSVEELQILISKNFFAYNRGCISKRDASFL